MEAPAIVVQSDEAPCPLPEDSNPTDIVGRQLPNAWNNAGYLATIAVLFPSQIMMPIATALTEWSTSPLYRAGLWQQCARATTSADWVCASLGAPVVSNALVIICRINAIWACVSIFLGIVQVISAFVMRRRIAQWMVPLSVFGCVCQTWTTFGTWLGIHGTYYSSNGLGLMLGSSFILCVISSVLTLLAMIFSVWGMRIALEQLKVVDTAAVLDAPGMSEDEGREYTANQDGKDSLGDGMQEAPPFDAPSPLAMSPGRSHSRTEPNTPESRA